MLHVWYIYPNVGKYTTDHIEVSKEGTPSHHPFDYRISHSKTIYNWIYLGQPYNVVPPSYKLVYNPMQLWLLLPTTIVIVVINQLSYQTGASHCRKPPNWPLLPDLGPVNRRRRSPRARSAARPSAAAAPIASEASGLRPGHARRR